MTFAFCSARLHRAYLGCRELLISEQTDAGHWVGELSTSALSTATAVMALHQVSQRQADQQARLSPLIGGGRQWLLDHQNADGGWGDTVKSFSNISTTMLSHATLVATEGTQASCPQIAAAEAYIKRVGGVAAVKARYGKDQTFSVPILMHCALAGLVDWQEVGQLPFEMACVPHKFYATIRLPVVSYALPALIAVGQVRHHFARSRILPLAWLRDRCIDPSLRLLTKIQPESGGFLEATPLTSFVTMSLAAKGLADHPVVASGVDFLERSVLEDSSWPIDTNLATWVTTLAVNALAQPVMAEPFASLPDEASSVVPLSQSVFESSSKTVPQETLGVAQVPHHDRILDWLLQQQYTTVHPFTNAAPGGWAWTDLSGGVPDADDTPGAILAILNLSQGQPSERAVTAIRAGMNWLIDLQNRDGGWPTFCRGWGTLPFDRSSNDITAHGLRALHAGARYLDEDAALERTQRAVDRGFQYLAKTQNADGSWLPLWFGNQHGLAS